MKQLWQSLEQYLLIASTLSFLTGILLHHLFPATLAATTVFSALLFIPALLAVKQDARKCSLIFLLFLICSLGFFRGATHSANPAQNDHINTRITEETDVILSGTLYSMPLFDGEKTTILLKSRTMRTKQEPFFTPVFGLVQLRLQDLFPLSLVPGDELLIRCKLSRPYRFGNPGGFDYPAFLVAQNIYITGRISSTAHIHALQSETSWLHTLRYIPEQLRMKIRDLIDQSLSPAQAGIYKALLIGDRSGIDKHRLEAFKASGIIHILAISGLHLSLVASTLFLLFYWLARRSEFLLLRFSCKKLALLATIPPLCAYALLAGAQTPVLRSLIMVTIFILAFCVQRQRSPFTTLSFAALLILLINPMSLFTVSFQLSFAAVASLILILPHLMDLIKETEDTDSTFFISLTQKLLFWIYAALLVSLTATIGTAPLLLQSFNRISVVGPLANLLLEPLLCLWSLPFGLLSIPFLFFAPEFAKVLLSLGGYGITAAINLTDFFSRLPLSTLWSATPGILLILLYYLSLCSCFSKLARKHTVPIFILFCTFFFLPTRSFLDTFRSDSELVFLDVGQGNATFIRFPGGKKILIDGGGASSKKFNIGESVIAPYLWHRGVTDLDAILITHPDADHYNGIPFLLRRFKPETLWINGEDGHDLRYRELLDIAQELHITVKKASGEDMILSGQEAGLQNINNPLQEVAGESSNDKSVILRFTDDSFSCILTGDISTKVEEALLRKDIDLKATILLSPHHGSKTSSSYDFLEAIKPEQIVVSAGRFRPGHFPSPQLREFCKNKPTPLLNTAEVGAINVRIKDKQATIELFNFRKQ